MKRNVGSNDKIIRYILGIVIIAIGIMYNSWWGIIGLIPIFTAAIGWCPLYALFKTSTNQDNKG
ncbi:MAG: DUF2892 domain-containing protein [Halanaerobiales bacterium]|nr:DUF2892 domain-containing protein [Halanaerobiales bacterium]